MLGCGIGCVMLEKLGNFVNSLGVFMFEVVMYFNLNSVLFDKVFYLVFIFFCWIVELLDNVEWGNIVDVVCIMICIMGYEEWLYEISVSFKVVEMVMVNVSILFGWVNDMLEGNDLD